MIYGSKIVDGVYKSKYNFELEFNSPNFIGVKSDSRALGARDWILRSR
jgi:hypothetical protein